MGKTIARWAGLATLCALGACASSGDGAGVETSSRAGGYVWPVDHAPHQIASDFGARGGRGQKRDFHRGVDITAPRGAAVVAVASGTVTVAGTGNGYGRYIVVDHGKGMSTLYAHLLDLGVRRGERVGAGEPMGRVGKSGNATGYHLHFEVRREGQPVDPRSYLR